MAKTPRDQRDKATRPDVDASAAGRRPRKKFIREAEPLPAYLEDYKGSMTNSNFGPEDFVWIGDDGSLAPEKLLEDKGYEPQGALRLILEAIIAAHPDADQRDARLRANEAEGALIGKRPGRGNAELPDEDLLREIGRRYFKLSLAHRSTEIEVGPIAKAVLGGPGRVGHIQESMVRRLQRKFADQRDHILARATTDVRWDIPDFYVRLRRIFDELEALGVKIDKSILEKLITNSSIK